MSCDRDHLSVGACWGCMVSCIFCCCLYMLLGCCYNCWLAASSGIVLALRINDSDLLYGCREILFGAERAFCTHHARMRSLMNNIAMQTPNACHLPSHFWGNSGIWLSALVTEAQAWLDSWFSFCQSESNTLWTENWCQGPCPGYLFQTRQRICPVHIARSVKYAVVTLQFVRVLKCRLTVANVRFWVVTSGISAFWTSDVRQHIYRMLQLLTADNMLSMSAHWSMHTANQVDICGVWKSCIHHDRDCAVCKLTASTIVLSLHPLQ